MKALLLIDSLMAGGKERRLLELIKGFNQSADLDLHLVIFSDRIHYKEVFELGIPVTILRRVPKYNPIVFYKLLCLCKKIKPDFIHSWGSMSPILALPSSIFLRIKLINGYIVNAPDNMNYFDSRLIRSKLTFPFSKIVVGNSLAGLKAYGAPADKSVCIYNGFDINRTSKIQDKAVIRKKFDISTKNVVGMVGSFYGKKDYQTYIVAALNILNQRNDVSFVAVGGGGQNY